MLRQKEWPGDCSCRGGGVGGWVGVKHLTFVAKKKLMGNYSIKGNSICP